MRKLPIWAQFFLLWVPLLAKAGIEQAGFALPAWLFLLSLLCAFWLCSMCFYYLFVGDTK
jgi:hypothetical protein